MEGQMEVYEGIVQDRVVVLPEGVHLEDGLHVEIRIRKVGHESPEELFKKRLVEAGLIERPRKSPWPLADQGRTPIQVQGKLLSEQIIEERR
jgi:hypothetical protein